MSAPAKPGDLRVIEGRYCTANAVAAFVLGCTVGAAGYANLVVPAAAVVIEQPRTVSATLMKIGQHLCADWSGLRNITRVGEKSYTFTCEKYAEFKRLEVHK